MRLIFALKFVSFVVITFGYQSGKEYKHILESYVYTSIRNSKNQYSGTALIGDVIIQIQEDNYLIQINDIRFDVVNQQIDGPFEKHPFTFKETRAFSDHISKPFKAVVESGQIKQIFIGDDEPDWSINWKKSFLNILQLSFKNDSNGPTFYTVSEKGSFGECDTTYSIRSEPSHSHSEKVLNVTKVRNYEKCLKRSHPYRYAAEVSQQCLEFNTIRKPILQISSVYDYNLSGNLKNFTLEKVVQREYISSSPFGKDGLTFDLKSKRVLELLSVNNIVKPILIPEDIIGSTDLLNSPLQNNGFFDAIDLRRANFLRDIYRYEATHNQIVTLLDEAIADYSASDINSAESVLPSKYGEIIDALSTLDYEAIEQIYKSATEKSDEHRSLFIDGLVSSATNPSFLFIKKLIEDKKVHGLRAQSMLTRVSLNIKESSETLFEEYYQLCTSSPVQESFQLKKSCYLSFSALVGKECVQRYKAIPKHVHNHNKKVSENTRNICNPDVSGKYFKLLIAPESGAQISLRDTILLLKTSGNFKAKEVIPFIRSYIKSAHKHYIRATAVWKLVGIARSYPEEVRSLSAPLFYNQTEEQDIRIAALFAWLYSGPSLAQLHLIAKQLLVENNRQIVNMAYTTIKWLTDSIHPCHKPNIKDLQSVLWLYKIAFDRQGGRVRRGDSRTYIRSIFDEQFGIGGIRQLTITSSNRSYIPNNIYFSFSDFVATNSFDVFAISIQSYGLDKLYNQFFGKKGIVWGKNSVLDIFKKRIAKRDVPSIEEELQSIESNLPFEKREYEPISGDISLYNQGYTIDYIEFDEQMFNSILKEGTINIPDLQKMFDMSLGEKKHRYFSQSENRIIILRNEVGIPYFFEYKTLSQTNFIYNKFKFTVEPSLFGEDRNNDSPTDFRLSSDLRYISNSHKYSLAGILLPIVTNKVGVGISRKTIYSIPLNFDLNYDIRNGRIDIRKTPIIEDIFYDRVTPFTYLDSYANKIPLISEPGFKAIYDESHMRKFDKSYLKDYLGFGIRLDGNIRKTDKNDWFRIFMEKSFTEKYAFFRMLPMANPHEIRVRTTAPVDKPSTQLSISIFSDNNTDDVNKVNDFSFNEDSYFKDYTLRKDRIPQTYSLNVKFVGTGDIERQINAKIRYMHSRDRLLHKFNFNYERKPTNDNGFRICVVSSMKFPEYDLKKLIKLETLDLDHTVNLTTKIAFGQNCETESQINIKSQMSQTEEQKQLELLRNNKTIEEKANPYAINYDFCLNSFKFKYDSFPYCHKYLYPISQMRKLVTLIDYRNISERMTNNIQKMFRLINKKQNQYSDMIFRYDSPTPGHIRFESNTSVVSQKADYRLYAPYYTQIFKEVPLSPNLLPVFTFPLHDLQYIRVLRKVIKNPHCIIQGNIVQTFDNVTYSLPNIDSQCFIVVAKDCSEEHNFLILAKIDGQNSTKIRVYLGNNQRIDLIPNNKGIGVEINGNEVTITQSEPYEHIIKSGNKDIELFSITFNGLYYKLEANSLGISISTDGFGFSAGVERYYAGKVCGICGDNNGDATHEFRASNGRIFRNSESFSYSYVLNSTECLQTYELISDSE